MEDNDNDTNEFLQKHDDDLVADLHNWFEGQDALKLAALASDFGCEIEDLLEQSVFDSVSPGICVSSDCDYSAEVEPDCRDGYCEVCDANTVMSCLVLADII